MNKTETVLLCRYVKAMCPAQAIDEYTPDAWADILDDVELDEAKAAIREGIRDRGWRFIDVTDVVDGVRQRRRARLDEWVRAFGPLLPPYELGDKPKQEHEWLMSARRRILDGEVTHPSQLGVVQPDVPLGTTPKTRDVVGELGTVGREVPRT